MKKNFKNQDDIRLIKTIVKAFFIASFIFIIIIFFVSGKLSKTISTINYFDENAIEIDSFASQEEKILEELQKYADSSNFSIEMNAQMIFPSSSEQGTLYIANPESNRLNMSVVITLNETGEVVYRTGVLKPGDYIDKDTLQADLKKGSYPATATINAILTNSSDIVGQIDIDVTIQVLK